MQIDISTISILLSLLGGVVGALTSVWTALSRSPSNRAPSLEDKVAVLTSSLNQAAKAISEVESEVRNRQQLADKLRKDAEEARKIVTLNKEQVEAVSQALRGQLQQRERATYWRRLAENFFFAVLGVALSESYRWISGH
jgi:gas vesicle protein